MAGICALGASKSELHPRVNELRCAEVWKWESLYFRFRLEPERQSCTAGSNGPRRADLRVRSRWLSLKRSLPTQPLANTGGCRGCGAEEPRGAVGACGVLRTRRSARRGRFGLRHCLARLDAPSGAGAASQWNFTTEARWTQSF